MRVLPCPFCPTGLPWNQCGCPGAAWAQKTNLIEARKRYPALNPGAGAEPARSPINREETGESSEAPQSRERKKRGRTAGSIPATGVKPKRPAEKIEEGLREALAIAKGEAEPFRVVVVRGEGAVPPLYDLACPSCLLRQAADDARRAADAAKTAERVRKWRERRAKEKAPE